MEFLLVLTMIGWPVALMKIGARVSKYLRDREIDREIADSMWTA